LLGRPVQGARAVPLPTPPPVNQPLVWQRVFYNADGSCSTNESSPASNGWEDSYYPMHLCIAEPGFEVPFASTYSYSEGTPSVEVTTYAGYVDASTPCDGSASQIINQTFGVQQCVPASEETPSSWTSLTASLPAGGAVAALTFAAVGASCTAAGFMGVAYYPTGTCMAYEGFNSMQIIIAGDTATWTSYENTNCSGSSPYQQTYSNGVCQFMGQATAASVIWSTD